jgi:hypothetical protein
MRAAVVALGVLALAVAAGAQSAAPTASVDLGGKLYRSVFASGVGMLTAKDLETIPEPLRSRLGKYLARRAAFKSGYKSETDTLEKVRADAKKREIERAIVAMIDQSGIEKIAADYVATAHIVYNWAGLHDGPLGESKHAEGVLAAQATTPLAPWLYVFIAQRQRVAFETFENEKDEAGMKAAAQKYRTYVDRARAVPDPFYAALVDDMDRLPFLYIKTTSHPGSYGK